MALVLASRSPQRRAILDQLGLTFTVRPSDAAELTSGEPHAVALENARRKALAVAQAAAVGNAHPEVEGESDSAVVLGVDTIVVLDEVVYGKPADAVDARATLEKLGGRTHEVVSGVCLVVPGDSEPRTAVATTRVTFRELDEKTLNWYIASEEWRDRAGGYAIQQRGAALVASLDGDYLNVVGLPVAALLKLLPDILQRFA